MMVTVTVQDVGSKLCPRTGEICGGGGVCRGTLSATEPLWYSPSSLRDVFAIVSAHPDAAVKLVAGNTGRGEEKEGRVHVRWGKGRICEVGRRRLWLREGGCEVGRREGGCEVGRREGEW